MKKRIISILMVVVVASTLLVGCGGSNNAGNGNKMLGKWKGVTEKDAGIEFSEQKVIILDSDYEEVYFYEVFEDLILLNDGFQDVDALDYEIKGNKLIIEGIEFKKGK